MIKTLPLTGRLVFSFLFLIHPSSQLLFSQHETDDHSSSDGSHQVTHGQLKIGERLFYGLLPIGEEAVACAACHNTVMLDTLNWNPSAYDIALTSAEMSEEQFSAKLLNPAGNKLSRVHRNYELSADQLVLIKAFLAEIEHEGLTSAKPVVTKRLLFVLALILIFAAFTGIIMYRNKLYRLAFTLIIVLAAVYVTKETVHAAIAVGRSPGYAPDQPIKFSHLVHSGENKIDCKYCHSTVAYARQATIPAAGVCLNCHQYVVREGTRSGTFEIRKIMAAYREGKPIVWNRVYSLPDHVYFSHAQHVGIGGQECATCHGKVEEMHLVKAHNDMSMGWCVNCHRDTEVQFFDNDFYAKYERLHEALKSGRKSFVSVEDIGGIECMKCHY